MTLANALVAALAVVFISGCGNTAAGMKEDSKDNGQKSAEQAQNISRGANEAGKNFGAATTLTPVIKTAIVADKRLNDPKNLIDVSCTSETVNLSGHVTSQELKDLAESITTKTLKEKSAIQKIENKLTIMP